MDRFRISVVLCAILLWGCGETPDESLEIENIGATEAAIQGLGHGQIQKFFRGRDLFFNETFDGNDRTCETCHLRRNVFDNFDLTPQDAQAIFAADPTDPLFRAIDSDDGAGQDYSTLLNHGLTRVSLPLPPNVTVQEVNSPLVKVDPVTGVTYVTVLRSVPSIENSALEENLSWDGRAGADLEAQVEGAVNAHYEPGRQPTASEKDDLEFFQERFFTNLKLRLYANNFPPPELPQAPAGQAWDSERRGRDFFVSQGPIDANHRGLCATCHSGPMLDTTDDANPVQPPGEKLSSNNIELDIGLPELTYNITLTENVTLPPNNPLNNLPFPFPPLIPAGTVLTLKTTDPGRLLVTGNPCELQASCFINPFSTVPLFKIPSLWGSADTAPYFHDNSASDLEDVMDRYEPFFNETAVILQNPAFAISQQDRDDIIAYMNFAFKRKNP